MKRKKKRDRQLAKLGITDFEAAAAAARRQQDMLRRLERALLRSWPTSWLGGL